MRSVHFYNKNAVCFFNINTSCSFFKVAAYFEGSVEISFDNLSLCSAHFFFLFIIDTNWKFLLKLTTSYEPA